MHTTGWKKTLKDWMLPIAMAGGALFHEWIHYLTFLSPYLIFLMLTVTYCRVEPRDLRLGPFHWRLLIAQMMMALIALLMLLPLGHNVATGVFICFFVPTATAAPVITSMLGGSITKVASFSLLCNLFVAFSGPVILAAIGDHPEIGFFESFLMICRSVVPLLILPMITAFSLAKIWPRAHDCIRDNQSISFYMWALALFIVVGSSVSFVIRVYTPALIPQLIMLLVLSFLACIAQFAVGKAVGRKYHEVIAGGQALGQKNTVLGIWLALAYLNPVASIAPAGYVAWHNIVNSWQLIRYRRHSRREA